MASKSVSVIVFGIINGLLLVAIVATLVVMWRRKRQDQAVYHFNDVDLRLAVHRTEVPRNASTSSAGARAAATPPPKELSSAFPSWSTATPAHEILGIRPDADPKTIEAAYRALLRKYHPDRFAHWGRGYQTRAHHVVLLLQKARDILLGRRQ